VNHDLATRHYAYLVFTGGGVRINGAEYGARDGIAIHGHSILRIDAIEDVELVMVDSA